MNRRTFLCGLTLVPLAAEAQSAGKVHRIGFILTGAPNEIEHLSKAFDVGLRDLGYVEGRNTVFERRFAGGKQERLPALAAELVRLNVDVIVTGSNPVIAAVKQTTATIPVVMAVSRDPVGSGFIASLARPGGNITSLHAAAAAADCDVRSDLDWSSSDTHAMGRRESPLRLLRAVPGTVARAGFETSFSCVASATSCRRR